MKLQAIHAGTDGGAAHREAQALLPWLANGRLEADELVRTQAHLQACAACSADLAEMHLLRAAEAAGTPACDPERALASLLRQLDAPRALAPASAPAPLRGWRTRLAANDARWLRLAAGLQCGVIVVLGALLLRPAASGEAPAGAYRVLGAAGGAQGRLVVSFKPDTPENELRRIVLDSGAHVVGGPTAAGAWMLGTADDTRAVAAHLRTQPAVTLAEPLGAEGRP